MYKTYTFTAENAAGHVETWELKLIGSIVSNFLVSWAETEPFVIALLAKDGGVENPKQHLCALMAEAEFRSKPLFPIKIGDYELHQYDSHSYSFYIAGGNQLGVHSVELILSRIPGMRLIR